MKAALTIPGLILTFLVGLTDQGEESPRTSVVRGPRNPVIHSDAHGAIEQIVVLCGDVRQEILYPTLEDLFHSLSEDTRITVVFESAGGERRLRTALRQWRVPNLDRFTFIVARHSTTIWARDRFVCREQEGRVTILVPSPERSLGDSEREGDTRIPLRLAENDASLRVERSALFIEGGNVVSNESTVFVGYNAVHDNTDGIGIDDDEAEEAIRMALARELGKHVVLIGAADTILPNDHVDMFMTPLGGGRVLVGDPRLAQLLLADDDEPGLDFSDWTFAEEYSDALDQVADQLRGLGLQVIRVPLVASSGENSPWVTYNNVLMEERQGKRIVYLSVYGVDSLDETAVTIWDRLGYEVKPIRAAGIACFGGTVRCVTNILRRGPTLRAFAD